MGGGDYKQHLNLRQCTVLASITRTGTGHLALQLMVRAQLSLHLSLKVLLGVGPKFTNLLQGPGKHLSFPEAMSVSLVQLDMSAVQMFPTLGLFNRTMSCVIVSTRNIEFLQDEQMSARIVRTSVRENWSPLQRYSWLLWQSFFWLCTLDAMPG